MRHKFSPIREKVVLQGFFSGNNQRRMVIPLIQVVDIIATYKSGHRSTCRQKWIPMWNSPAWKRPFPCNSTVFLESSIPIGYFRNFSDKFWPIPVGKHRKFIGICRKKSHRFSTGILLPIPVISGVFLWDPRIFPASFLKDLNSHFISRVRIYKNGLWRLL